MIITLAIWGYMTLVFTAIGMACMRLIKKITGYSCRDYSIIWMMGLCLTTVYAEYLSILAGVGMLANIVLLVGVLFCLWMEKKQLIKCFKGLEEQGNDGKKRQIVYWIIGIILLLVFAVLASQKAHHADTDLYHAQAIRWIEDYGLVKGLGNLHNRLAYNSSFMCLQALFSGKFLLDQSTHVVNGYICFCACLYAVLNLLRADRIESSKLFCVAMVYSIISTIGTISSPNSDILVLLSVLFILEKWCELVEIQQKDDTPYCILCIIAVFAISVKLSAAMIVLLVLKPAYDLIQRKRWKDICFYLLFGMIVLVPFLIRNVVISGYLVYPYSLIDLFSVDWKMPKSVVDFDKREIMIYAKGISDYFQSNAAFREWFPIWWQQQDAIVKILIFGNIICLVAGCVYPVISLIKKKKMNGDRILLWGTAGVMLLFWFMTAPSARYGRVFLLCLPCLLLGKMMNGIRQKKVIILLGSVSLVLVIGLAGMQIVERKDEISLKRPGYYVYRECEKIDWENIDMYVAIENNYCGYYYLPSTPYGKTLDFIEMRGTDIKDGFRTRAEVKGICYNNSGMIYTPVQ